MNAELIHVQKSFLDLYRQQRDALADKPTRQLQNLLHEAEELRHDNEFSIRASAEINRAACTVILEQRDAAPK